MRKERDKTSRRGWLKMAGVAGATALAGCSGQDDTSTDDSGNGSGTTSDTELTSVNITLAPDGFQGIMMDHVHGDTDILANQLDGAGYQANVQQSWEDAALFASGGPDFSTMSSLEAARLGAEREIDLVVIGKVAPLFKGMWVAKGGEYDPERTGGAQATIDAIVENDEPMAIGSWAGGEIPGYMTAFESEFGHAFSQEDSEFNIVTADYAAIPQLVLQGDAAIGDASPIHGIARHLDDAGDPQHSQVFNCAAVLEDAGIGLPMLNSLVTTREFIDENREAAAAVLRAWHEGMNWLFEDPMGRILEDRETHFEQLAIETEAQAQYLVDWGVNTSLENEYPFNYEDQELTDSFIEKDKGFINRVAELGVAPSNWADHVTYEKISQT